MSLIAPLNLLFLGLIGAIVLLYVLRLKRKERIVSSTLLWQSALRDLQANAPWQKLRSSLLMWLQIAFLALVAFALARPAMKILATTGQTVAIVLDASASMAATDIAPTRFANARSQAEKLINGLGNGDSATIIQCGAQTRVLSPLTTDKGALKRALARARTEDTGNNLREGIVLATSLLRNQKAATGRGQIYLYSDGAVPPIADLNTSEVGLQFVKVGRGSDNVAITAMDVRRDYSSRANNQIFVNLRNYSSRARSVNLELLRDGNLVAVEPLQLPAYDRKNSASGQKSHIFEALPFQQGLFQARFDEQDDLPSDNAAFADLAPPQNLRVLLISEGNLFLERALNIDPFIELFRASKADFDAGKASGKYDVIVLDGNAPVNVPDSNQLLFATLTDLAPVTVTGQASAPGVADWDKKHPVTRFEPWGDVRFARSQAATLKPWGVPLVEAERTPLVVAGEKRVKTGVRRVVWCGFDIRETDLPLRVAFPIFIHNSVHWLASAQSATQSAPRRAGELIPLTPPQGVAQITVTAPDKSKQTLDIKDGMALYSAAYRVGVYQAKGKAWTKPFAISLLNKQESDIQPGSALQLQGGKPLLAENSARANRELWSIVALCALALLALEWWIYHRGV